MEPAAAPAPAAPAAPTDPMESAVAAYRARQDQEAAAAEGKGPAPATAGTQSAASAPGAPSDKPRPKAADLGALAQREWAAQQREQRAAKLEAKYKPLDDTLGGETKNLRGALEAMAKEYNVTFEKFVEVLTEAAPPEKTAAQVAEETVATKLAERDADAAKAQAAQQQQANAAQEVAFRTSLQEQAEKGAEGAPDRWELTAIAGKAGEAWDVIWGHYMATAVRDAQGNVIQHGERMSREQALDLLESKLVEKRNARRPKQDAVTGSAAVNGRNEAAGQQGSDGRAAAPSFTNRATSGIPAVAGATPAYDSMDVPDHERIRLAAKRAGITLY